MDEKSCELYAFEELSETAKQKALKTLEKPFIEVGDTVWETEALREDIDNVWFYEDGTIA
jgi:hypothetical protein